MRRSARKAIGRGCYLILLIAIISEVISVVDQALTDILYGEEVFAQQWDFYKLIQINTVQWHIHLLNNYL